MSSATAAGASPALPLSKPQADVLVDRNSYTVSATWPGQATKRARRELAAPTADVNRLFIEAAARVGLQVTVDATDASDCTALLTSNGAAVSLRLTNFSGTLTFPVPCTASGCGDAPSSDAPCTADAVHPRCAAPLQQPADDDLQLSQDTYDTVDVPLRAGVKRSRREASASIASSSAPVVMDAPAEVQPREEEGMLEDAAYHLTPPDTPDWLRTQSNESETAAAPPPPPQAIPAPPAFEEPVVVSVEDVGVTSPAVVANQAPVGGSAVTRTRVRGRKPPAAAAAAAASSTSHTNAAGRGGVPPLVGMDELLLPASGDGERATRAVVGFLWHRLVFSAPPARMWAHAAALTASQLVLCGGETATETDASASSSSGMHVWTCAPATRAWDRVSVDSLHASRSWGAHVYIPSSRTLFIHGGESDDLPHVRGDEAVDARALTALDTSLMVSYTPTVSGKPPCVRSGHSLVRVCDASTGAEIVVLFGGIRGRQWLNDVWVCTPSTLRWTHVRTSQTCPCAPRSYHSAVACGTRMIVMGGNNGDRCFDDVYVLDCTPAFSHTNTTTDAHGLQSLAESAHTWSWSKPVCVGGGPCARTGGYAVALNDRFIVYGGGWDPDHAATRTPAPARGRGRKKVEAAAAEASPQPFRDVFLLDTLTWEWLRIAHDYATPPPAGMDTRAYADSYAARVGAAALLIHDVEAWTGVRTRAEPRMGVMLTCGMLQESVYDNGVVILAVPDVVARAMAPR